MTGRIYLCVPGEERLQAGASYDMSSLSCYVEKDRFDADRVRSWLPTFDVRPDPLPGSSWYDNVRSAVPPEEWRRLKKSTYDCYGHRCACCGDRGPEWPVECHEACQRPLAAEVDRRPVLPEDARTRAADVSLSTNEGFRPVLVNIPAQKVADTKEQTCRSNSQADQ